MLICIALIYTFFYISKFTPTIASIQEVNVSPIFFREVADYLRSTVADFDISMRVIIFDDFKTFLKQLF